VSLQRSPLDLGASQSLSYCLCYCVLISLPFDNGEAMEGLELMIEEYGDSACKQKPFQD
jgi:hypothetical protein